MVSKNLNRRRKRRPGGSKRIPDISLGLWLAAREIASGTTPRMWRRSAAAFRTAKRCPYLVDPSLESNRREKNRGATSNTRADVRPELAG